MYHERTMKVDLAAQWSEQIKYDSWYLQKWGANWRTPAAVFQPKQQKPKMYLIEVCHIFIFCLPWSVLCMLGLLVLHFCQDMSLKKQQVSRWPCVASPGVAIYCAKSKHVNPVYWELRVTTQYDSDAEMFIMFDWEPSRVYSKMGGSINVLNQ